MNGYCSRCVGFALLLTPGVLSLTLTGAYAAEPITYPQLQPGVPYAFAMQIPTPAVDGDLSDWHASGATLFPIVMGKEHMDNVLNWNGPEDLSATAYVGWNETGFFFAAEVHDDVQEQTKTQLEMWQGDCIQFSLDPLFDRATSYASDDYEYGVSLTPAGPQVVRWAAGGGNAKGLVAGAKVAVIRDEANKVTRYEVALPAGDVAPAKLAAGSSLGFSWIINEADGQGRAGWAEWTGGIGATKDPSLYGQLILLGDLPQTLITLLQRPAGEAAFKGGKSPEVPAAPQLKATEMEVFLNLDDPANSHGISFILTEPDGVSRLVSERGRTARKALPGVAPDQYLYVAIDDNYLFDVNVDVLLTIEYLDTDGTLRVQYDSNDPSAPVDGAYKDTEVIKLNGTRKWVSHTFVLRGARLANRQNGGADLRIVKPSGELFIAAIGMSRVSK